MASTSISKARTNLYKLVETTIKSHEPTIITTKDGDVVIVSLEDFEAMQESLTILQTMPGIAEEAKQAKEAPDEDFIGKDDLEW